VRPRGNPSYILSYWTTPLREGSHCILILKNLCIVTIFSLLRLTLSRTYEGLCLGSIVRTASGSNWGVQGRPLPLSREIAMTVPAFNDKRSVVPGCHGRTCDTCGDSGLVNAGLEQGLRLRVVVAVAVRGTC
jgi:hypothetical protein